MSKPTLKIGHFPIIDHLVLGIAEHNEGGYFENFTLETKRFHNWEKMCTSLKSGAIDGTFMLFPLAQELFRQGTDIRIVLLGQREGQVLIARPEIHTVRDLKNKLVLLPHRYSIHNILLHEILTRAGLDPARDVKYQFGFEDVREIPQMLAQGKIDAFFSAEPWTTLAQKSIQGNILALSQNVEPHHICCVLVLHDKIIQKYPQACEELIRSLVKAGMFINAYPRQAAEISTKFVNYPKATLLPALTHDRGHVLFWDLLPRLEDFEESQRIAVEEMHLWDKSIDLRKILHTDFAQRAYRDWMIDTRRTIKDKGGERTLPGNFADAAHALSDALGRTVSLIGTHAILRGKKYPTGLNQTKPQTITTDIIAEAMQGKECLVQAKGTTHKAIALISPSRGIEPERVILELTPDEVKRCHSALVFGNINNQLKSTSLPELVTTSGEATAVSGKTVFYALDYNAFRFLSLLIHKQ